MRVLLALAFLMLISMCSADTQTFDWTSGFNGPSNRALTVNQGTTLVLTWNNNHNVWKVPTKADFDNCNFADGTELCTTSPCHVPISQADTYLACEVASGGHCRGGQKLHVTGTSTGGTSTTNSLTRNPGTTTTLTPGPTYGAWGLWSGCSRTCGYASKTRSRTCSSNVVNACASQGGAVDVGTCTNLPTCCDTNNWPNWAVDRICGKCSAVIRMDSYRTCNNFCQQQGLRCVASFEEKDDGCTAESGGYNTCATDYTVGSNQSDDAYCECSSALKIFVGLASVVLMAFNF